MESVTVTDPAAVLVKAIDHLGVVAADDTTPPPGDAAAIGRAGRELKFHLAGDSVAFLTGNEHIVAAFVVMLRMVLVNEGIGRIIEGHRNRPSQGTADGETTGAVGVIKDHVQGQLGRYHAARVGLALCPETTLQDAQSQIVRSRRHRTHKHRGKDSGGAVVGDMDEVTQRESAAGRRHPIRLGFAFHRSDHGIADP